MGASVEKGPLVSRGPVRPLAARVLSGPRPPVGPGAGEGAPGPIAERTEASQHPGHAGSPIRARAAGGAEPGRSEQTGQDLLPGLGVAVLVLLEVALPCL